MKIKINRSPLKVLWINTSLIWNLDITVWKKMANLIVKEKIIVVDTGQLAEMTERYSEGSISLNKESKTTLEIYKSKESEFGEMIRVRV